MKNFMISFIMKHIDALGIECDFVYDPIAFGGIELIFLSIADKNLFLLTFQKNVFKSHPASDKILVYCSSPFDFHDQQNINEFIGKF